MFAQLLPEDFMTVQVDDVRWHKMDLLAIPI